MYIVYNLQSLYWSRGGSMVEHNFPKVGVAGSSPALGFVMIVIILFVFLPDDVYISTH